MYSNHLMNMPTRINPRNLGFHISPDITIEYVRPKASVSPTPQLAAPTSEPSDDDEDYDDSYFNPLTFCAIKMEEDTAEDELEQPLELTVAKLDSKAPAKRPKSAANENSSFVCNAAGAAAKPKKRHACHLCPKTFGWTTDLKRHLLIHTGERPFKCTLCNATFTRNFLLQKHKTKIHQCLSPTEVSQLNNNVAKNVMEIKQKMRELEKAKVEDSQPAVSC